MNIVISNEVIGGKEEERRIEKRQKTIQINERENTAYNESDGRNMSLCGCVLCTCFCVYILQCMCVCVCATVCVSVCATVCVCGIPGVVAMQRGGGTDQEIALLCMQLTCTALH